jgi:outer membrane receptor protein involved in Fe transport
LILTPEKSCKAFPDPYQLVPYITQDQSTTPYTINVGNPALVAEHANDYDILYERYLPSVGMIEGGYFFKQITDPIFYTDGFVPATGSPLSQAYAGDHLLQEINGDHAWVQGIELAYRQHFNFLPGVLAGARIDTNFTYTSSKNYDCTESVACKWRPAMNAAFGPLFAILLSPPADFPRAIGRRTTHTLDRDLLTGPLWKGL